MIPAKTIAGFFSRFLLIFVLLMAPWPGLNEVYAAFFQAGGNALFAHFGAAGTVHFAPLAENPRHHTHLALRNQRTRVESVFTVDSRLLGYKPTVFVLALVLATPIPWSRRLRALLWGVVLVNAYVALRVGVYLLATFSEGNSLALFAPGPVARSALDHVHWVVVLSFSGSLILPLPVWVLVTFRRREWQAMLHGTASPHACKRGTRS